MPCRQTIFSPFSVDDGEPTVSGRGEATSLSMLLLEPLKRLGLALGLTSYLLLRLHRDKQPLVRSRPPLDDGIRRGQCRR